MRKLLFVMLLLLVPAAASAQVSVFNTYSIPTQPKSKGTKLTGTPGANVVLYTGASSKGSICFGGMLNSNDQSAAHAITFFLNLGAVVNAYASYTTASGGAANALNSPVNIFGPIVLGNTPIFPLNQNGNQSFFLGSGDTWEVNWAVAVTGGDSIGINVQCADFQ